MTILLNPVLLTFQPTRQVTRLLTLSIVKLSISKPPRSYKPQNTYLYPSNFQHKMSGKQLGANATLKFLYTGLKQLDMKNVCHQMPMTIYFSKPAELKQSHRSTGILLQPIWRSATVQPQGCVEFDSSSGWREFSTASQMLIQTMPPNQNQTNAKPNGNTGAKGEGSENEEEIMKEGED